MHVSQYVDDGIGRDGQNLFVDTGWKTRRAFSLVSSRVEVTGGRISDAFHAVGIPM